jgi:hypothetical protein
VLVASSGTGDVYLPATGTWTATGPMVYPHASAAAALLPNGQVLYAGGGKVKYCGQYFCSEPVADAELYTPEVSPPRRAVNGVGLLGGPRRP